YRIDNRYIHSTYFVNNNQFESKEEYYISSEKIKERLITQLETDVSLRVEDTESPDAWIVSGRGELHLSVLIENMRREGFELQISKQQVIVDEMYGQMYEPMERVRIDIAE